MKKKKISKIPTFRSLEDEAKFWDTHSFADYWDEMDDVDLIVELNKPRDETLVIRMQKKLKDRIERFAQKKGVTVSTLARLWFAEKLFPKAA